MGNTQPRNKTGRKVVEQKLENAKKTGVLSLSEHKLEHVPQAVYEISKLTTLDLSKNELRTLNDKLATLKLLKSLNVDDNQLAPGTLSAVAKLSKLKTLSANNNLLGRPHPERPTALPLPDNLPKGLKTLLLSRNFFSSIPRSILKSGGCSGTLERLDLSHNNLASVPDAIGNLKSLRQLNLDDNTIVSLPISMGQLSSLKVLSLKRNKLQVGHNNNAQQQQQQQPLPKALFSDTPLIDLNLHGNPITTTQLNGMEGFDAFLERRKDVKVKDLAGGAMTNFDVCGLK